MNILKKKIVSCVTLLLLLMVYDCSKIYGFEPSIESSVIDLIHRALENKLEITQLSYYPEFDNKQGVPLYNFEYHGKPTRVYLFGSIDHDFDGDGENDVIIGCEFYDKPEVNIDDFLVIYARKNDLLTQLFSIDFQPSDRGGFSRFQIEDITGNGISEIVVNYDSGSVGMIKWSLRENFFVIRGGTPFDTLLELQVRKELGHVRKDGYYMNTEVDIEDVNEDGLNEIEVVEYEGENALNTNKVTLEPLIYSATFKLTSYTFKYLRMKNISEEIVQALQPLKKQEFATKNDFLSTIEQQIGKEDTERYERLLVQYGISQYRLENDHE